MKKVCNTNQEDVVLKAQMFAKKNLSVEDCDGKIMEVYKMVLNKHNN